MSLVQRALGLDIGGTHTKLGIIAASGEILYQEILVTASHGDPAPYFKDMHERIQRLRAYYQPEGIGFSLPGLLSADRRVIEYNPNTPALVGADFWQEFSDFELPMAFETDLNTPALAEYHFGGYTRNTRLLAAAIGTGLGAAVVAEGRLVRLFGGVAGDNGQLPCNPADRPARPAAAAAPKPWFPLLRSSACTGRLKTAWRRQRCGRRCREESRLRGLLSRRQRGEIGQQPLGVSLWLTHLAKASGLTSTFLVLRGMAKPIGLSF